MPSSVEWERDRVGGGGGEKGIPQYMLLAQST